MTKGIWWDTAKVKKIWWDTSKVKKIWYGTTLIWTASEVVNGLSSAKYTLSASATPNIGSLDRLVDGNNTLQCTWNIAPQYIDFTFTDCYVEPTSLTIWSGQDNNAKNGVKIDSIVGITASGTTVLLWSNQVIGANSSITLTRNANDYEFKTIRFTISKNGSTNLTLGEIYFNTFVKYPL